MLEALLGVGGQPAWGKKASLTPRQSTDAVTINGKLYVFGGAGVSAVPLGDLNCYTPETDTWELKAPGPPARKDAAMGVVDGKLYIHGGYNASLGGVLSDVWCYDPADDTWAAKGNGPSPRTGAAGVGIEGHFFVLAGYANNNWDKTLWAYRVSTNQWIQLTSLPGVARQMHSLVEVGGKLYCYSGFAATGGLNDFWCYDRTSNRWTQLVPHASGTSRYLYAASALGGKLYIHGGWDTVGALNELLCYDPLTAAWTKLKTAHVLYDHFAATINNKLYVGGGARPNASVSGDLWEIPLA